MVLSVTLGGTTFLLTISSDGPPPSLVSVEQDQHNSTDCNDPDTKVHLRDFSGTLFISRHDSKQKPLTRESPTPDAEEQCRKSLSDAAQNSGQEAKSCENDQKEMSWFPNNKDRRLSQLKEDKELSFRDVSAGLDEDRNKSNLVSFQEPTRSRRSSFLSESEDESLLEDSFVNNSDLPLKDILQSVVQNTKSMRQGTRLHTLCQKREVKIKALLSILDDAPSYASSQDVSGMLPLHILAQNESFIFDHHERNVKRFTEHLIDAYPDAVSTLDDNRCVPFTNAILEWIRNIYGSESAEGVQSLKASMVHFDGIKLSHDFVLPTSVVATPIVRWSFSMLSWIIVIENASLESDPNSSERNLGTIKTNSEKVLDNVASLSNLLPTILLIDDDMYKEQLINCPLIRRILLRKEVVHEWLVAMLGAGGDKASRAIDYFEMLSDLKPHEALGIHRKLRPYEKKRFNQLRKEMIRHIADLDWILPSLFSLNENSRWRACKTHAVQQILDLATVNSSLNSLLFFELVLHILLLMAYHEYLSSFQNLDRVSKIVPFSPAMLIIWICIYFFARDNSFRKLMSKSWTEFCTKYRHFWNLIEISSIGFTFATTLSMLITKSIGHSSVSAVTVGLIWMRLLGFLKGINMHLALFTLSLNNIVKSIKWFMVVFCIGCAMFTHMMHIVTTTGPQGTCAEVDSKLDHGIYGDYCSVFLIRSFLRGYSILVGDIALDEYRDSSFITSIWTLFTFIGVIILLNVLIAIVNTSYDLSLWQRHVLFGKARIPLLAKHYFLEEQVIPLFRRSNNSISCIKRYSIISLLVAFFCLMEVSFIFFVGYIVASSEHFSSGFRYVHVILSLLIIAMANLAFIQVMALFGGWKFDESKFGRFVIKPSNNFFHSLFGFYDKEIEMTEDGEMGETGISERVLYGMKEFVDQSESRIKMELRRLESQKRK